MGQIASGWSTCSRPATLPTTASLHGTRVPLLGATVKDVWQRLLRLADRFVPVDSVLFLDPNVTSTHYIERYGGGLLPSAL